MAGESRHGRVVVGVDGSRYAANAADWAADEAAERGAALYLVYAFDLDPGSALIGPVGEPARDPARAARVRVLAETERRVRAAHPDLPMVSELVHRGPAAALIDASRSADLLVVGTRGRGGFAGLALGSVVLRVVAHSHCPVVVLRSPEHQGARFGEIVLGMERNEPHNAVRFAFETAARAGAGIRAVHAWAPNPGHAQAYSSDTDVIARCAADDVTAAMKAVREEYPHVLVRITAAKGHPVAVLVDASRGARLTVVGAHRHHGPLSLGVGPILQGLLAQAESPVAIVPMT
jgi:nucleotide-binding universal stress UspA family protein